MHDRINSGPEYPPFRSSATRRAPLYAIQERQPDENLIPTDSAPPILLGQNLRTTMLALGNVTTVGKRSGGRRLFGNSDDPSGIELHNIPHDRQRDPHTVLGCLKIKPLFLWEIISNMAQTFRLRVGLVAGDGGTDIEVVPLLIAEPTLIISRRKLDQYINPGLMKSAAYPFWGPIITLQKQMDDFGRLVDAVMQSVPEDRFYLID